MERPRRLLIVPALLLLAACSTTPRPEPDRPASDPATLNERRLAEEYHRQYAQYEIPQDALPELDRREFPHPPRHLLLGTFDGLRLELRLGQRRAVTSNSIYRTASHYRLIAPSGQVLATAESTLALQDLSPSSDTDLATVLCSDLAGRTWFIAEHQSWATDRFILIAPTAASSATSLQRWKVTYVLLPERSHTFPESPCHILGIHAGRLYFEQDQRIYAFPVDRLQTVTDLAYGIG